MLLPRTPVDAIRWLEVVNAAGEVIPAFGVVRPTSADASGVITVAKPNAASDQHTLVNGPTPIPIGSRGACTVDSPVHALYETGDGTPALGEVWGSGNGTFKLRKGNTGYMIVGGVTLGRVLASRAAVAGGGAGGMAFSGVKLTTSLTSIPDRTPTILDWTSENYDTDGYHSLVSQTSRITVPVGGVYEIGARVHFFDSGVSDNGIGDRIVSLLLGGGRLVTETKKAIISPTFGTHVGLTSQQLCIGLDYFEVEVFQSSGIGITVSSVYSEFWLAKLGN